MLRASNCNRNRQNKQSEDKSKTEKIHATEETIGHQNSTSGTKDEKGIQEQKPGAMRKIKG